MKTKEQETHKKYYSIKNFVSVQLFAATLRLKGIRI